MSETSGGLPLMAQTQNSRYLTFNELAWALNVLQTGVLDRDLTAPPGSPSEGDAYIVDSPATGAWAGHENDIAFFFDGIWNFLNPELGQGRGIWIEDEGTTVQYAVGSPTGWDISAGSSAFGKIVISGQSDVNADAPGDTLTLVAGSNVTLTTNAGGDSVTIAAASGGNSFGTVAVSGQSDVVADQTNDTLTLVAGSNVTLTTSAGGDSVTIAASGGGGSGAVVQVKNTQSGSVATGTTTIPADDTIPQNTEGTEFLTCSITPTSSSNKLKIDVSLFATTSTTAAIMMALFQDSTANALAAVNTYCETGGGNRIVTLTHYMTAGTTSATTFKVRAGPNSSATLTVNGSGGNRQFGGVAASSITIMEIVP